MKAPKYTTIFSSVIRPMVSEERDEHLALASALDVSRFVPNVDVDKNIDLLPIAFNACVINRVNLNGDVVDTKTALAMCDSFINKPIKVFIFYQGIGKQKNCIFLAVLFYNSPSSSKTSYAPREADNMFHCFSP